MCRAWHTSGNVHHIFGRNINRFQHRTWTFGNLNSILSENRYRIHDLQKLIHVREMPTWLGACRLHTLCPSLHSWRICICWRPHETDWMKRSRLSFWRALQFWLRNKSWGRVDKKIVRKGMKEKTILVLRCEENSVQKSAASAENLSTILRTVTYFRRG